MFQKAETKRSHGFLEPLVSEGGEMAPCKLKTVWLSEKDVNGHVIKSWGKKCENQSSLYCCACEKTVSVKRGKCGINQHAEGQAHKEKYRIKFGESQLHLGNLHDVNNSLTVFKPRQEAIKAELLYALRIISKQQSFESVMGLKEFLCSVFPNVQFLSSFSLSPKKMSYYVNFALAPYFEKLLTGDISGESADTCFLSSMVLMVANFCRLLYSHL